jgi:hypothetical protein
MKTIEIVVSPKGESKIETKGFSGAGCQEATRAMEQALGAKTSETLTGEYYTEVNTNHIEAQN